MAIVKKTLPKHDDRTLGIVRQMVRRVLSAMWLLALCGAPPHATALDSYTIDHNFSRLHSMLAANRFVHLPRGVEEAVFEQEAHVAAFPALAIETSLAIHMPLPGYFFAVPCATRKSLQ